jgi:dipeptidyl aminopeptidase/acylaminoacyl peptidase
VHRPYGWKKGKKYPIAFLIHGGPQGSFGNEFHYRWNPQVFAGMGYGVVTIDFHGSTGYGQAFTDSISGDWGGKPLEDLQKGLKYALEHYDFLDGGKACALGASYGGYMVNWIEGRWAEPFKCLVNHDGDLDLRFGYYATEELWFDEWERGGSQYLVPENFEKFNPIDYVNNWKTPMLVVHGGQDFRVPYVHGIATFTALQRRSVPSEFLYFPDENHWVLKPQNSVQWHQTVQAWLKKWIGP